MRCDSRNLVGWTMIKYDGVYRYRLVGPFRSRCEIQEVVDRCVYAQDSYHKRGDAHVTELSCVPTPILVMKTSPSRVLGSGLGCSTLHLILRLAEATLSG